MRRLLILSAAALAISGPALAQVPLAPGPGQATVRRLCSTCHTLDNVVRRGHSSEEWDAIIGRMMDKGLVATDAQLDEVAAYLSKNYAPAKAAKPH